MKNEKYKGDSLLQKYYRQDHICKRNKKNKGKREQYYVGDNHIPIISKEIWEQVQREMKNRSRKVKTTNRYPLSGLLICSKCGAKLKRRTWNSGKPCQKIVWQCGNYIKNGKEACTGTTIPEKVINQIDIKQETVVREWIGNGEKHYTYTRKNRE